MKKQIVENQKLAENTEEKETSCFENHDSAIETIPKLGF
jgi:hypothetical protein